MLLDILFALAFLAVIVAVIVLLRIKSVIQITRSLEVKASPKKVFPYINSGKLINEWNPFVDGDDSVTVTYSGPPEGVGARWAWKGKKAGEGQATIILSEPDLKTELRLHFIKPFNVTNEGGYSLAAKGDATFVTWTINETALIPRVIGVFLNIDKLVGSQFERGLQKLKTIVQAK